MYNDVGAEIPMQKRGRPNQLISLGEDARNFLIDVFYNDLSRIWKNKNKQAAVFFEEGKETSLNRVT